MPYDETITTNKIKELAEKLDETRNTRGDIHRVIDALQSVLDVQGETPAGGGEPGPKTKPIDHGTHKVMSTARRDQIYEASIIEADKLLT